MEILWYLCVPALVAFCFQFLIGSKTKRKILQYIPLYFLVLTLIFAIIAFTSDAHFFIGGNVIAALLWLIIGVCSLFGYVLAILLSKIKR